MSTQERRSKIFASTTGGDLTTFSGIYELGKLERRSPVVFEDGHRRFLITVGAARYGGDSGFVDLPSVEEDVRRIETVLGRYGYRHVLPEIALNARAVDIRTAVTEFCANAERREDDVIVFYFSGHGDEVHSGRHYLWPAGANKSNPAGTAIATGELARWFFEGGGIRAHNVLILLDACYGERARATSLPRWRF
jgi:hypothetical protein